MLTKMTLKTLQDLTARAAAGSLDQHRGELGLHFDGTWVPQDQLEAVLSNPVHVVKIYPFTLGRSIDVFLKIGSRWVEGNVVLVESRGKLVAQGPPPNWMSGNLLRVVHEETARGVEVDLDFLRREIENAANTLGEVLPTPNPFLSFGH